MHAEVFTRSEYLKRKHKNQDYIEVGAVSGPFEKDGLYTWQVPTSQTRIILMSIGMVLVGIAMCMVKAWPIWLRMIVWWMSSLYLVTFLTLVVLRLVIYVLCFAVGLRGVWLLPNLLDDECEVFESLEPLIKQYKWGEKVKTKRERDLQRYKEKTSEKKKAAAEVEKALKEGTPEAKAEAEKKEKERKEKEKKGQSRCSFGVINALVILVAGLYLCHCVGLFDPTNVPDFLVTQKELFASFPSLQPPGWVPPDDGIKSDEPVKTGIDAFDEVNERAGIYDPSLDEVGEEEEEVGEGRRRDMGDEQEEEEDSVELEE
jgi:hypothetical protein